MQCGTLVKISAGVIHSVLSNRIKLEAHISGNIFFLEILILLCNERGDELEQHHENG